MSLQYPEDQSSMVVFLPLNLTQETVFCTKCFKWMNPTLHNAIPGFLKKRAEFNIKTAIKPFIWALHWSGYEKLPCSLKDICWKKNCLKVSTMISDIFVYLRAPYHSRLKVSILSLFYGALSHARTVGSIFEKISNSPEQVSNNYNTISTTVEQRLTGIWMECAITAISPQTPCWQLAQAQVTDGLLPWLYSFTCSWCKALPANCPLSFTK